MLYQLGARDPLGHVAGRRDFRDSVADAINDESGDADSWKDAAAVEFRQRFEDGTAHSRTGTCPEQAVVDLLKRLAVCACGREQSDQGSLPPALVDLL